MTAKFSTADDAAALIRSGETIATSGFVGIGVPEELLIALESRFLETGEPRDLKLLFAAGQGDGGERGLNRLGHEGLIKSAVGGHWGLIPKVGKLAMDNDIEAWNLPQGVISQMFRETAGGRKGVLTPVGLGTFVDPRIEGGRINSKTGELVRLIEFEGEEMLFYPAIPIDVALLRASTADENGNLSMEREALVLDNLAMAMAARNSGGIVIAQVERVCESGGISPKNVCVPSTLVDAVVIASPENHSQTYATPYSPVFSGELRAPAIRNVTSKLDARKVIARRCAMELPPGGVVNLGIGVPEGVAAVADEEGVLNSVTLTAEPGIIGGRPEGGTDFGAAVNAEAIIPQNAQFDFYDGGGLDLAVLGMAEVDAGGDVNVSRFGGRVVGAGGFINISQNARKLVFAGTFTARGLRTDISDATLKITSEGRDPKFVSKVEQITFSAAQAHKRGTEVLYVTERAVFRLNDGNILLEEIAPGIDLERDVLAHMNFTPVVSSPKSMPKALFEDAKFGLEAMLFDLHLEDRIVLDTDRNRLYLNFENLRLRSIEDIEQIRNAVISHLAPLGRRVDVVINYNLFELPPELETDYANVVRALEETYYAKVSRYTSNAFMRMKLEKTLTRKVAPHLFETRDEAKAFLRGRE